MRSCAGCGARFESKYRTCYCDNCKEQGVRVYCGICGVRTVVPYTKHRDKVSAGGNLVFRCGSCVKYSTVQPELGNRYGKYLVVKLSHIDRGIAHWVCRCDCGEVVIVNGSALRNRQKSDSIPCVHNKNSLYLR